MENNQTSSLKDFPDFILKTMIQKWVDIVIHSICYRHSILSILSYRLSMLYVSWTMEETKQQVLVFHWKETITQTVVLMKNLYVRYCIIYDIRCHESIRRLAENFCKTLLILDTAQAMVKRSQKTLFMKSSKFIDISCIYHAIEKMKVPNYLRRILANWDTYFWGIV